MVRVMFQELRRLIKRFARLRTRFVRHGFLKFSLLIVVALLAVVASSLLHYSATRAQNKRSQLEQDLQKVFTTHEGLSIDPSQALQQVRATGRLSISTLSHRFDLELKLNDLRAPSYRAEEVVNGLAHDLPQVEVNTYKGTIAGMPGTDARFTIEGARVEGMIIAFNETYYVEPARKYSPAADVSDHLLYKASDVRPDITQSCIDTLDEQISSQVKQFQFNSATVQANAVFPMRVVEIATEADGEYVQASGGSAAANSDILGVINQVDAIYRRDLGLTFSVVFQHSWPDPATDPYVKSGNAVDVLQEFTDYWNGNISNPRDVAHMWTGRSLGGPAGVAWQGVVCRDPTAAYGVTIRETIAPFKTGLPAHEIGHNFNATHCDGKAGCDNTIMVATQTQSNTLTFCQFSIDEITNYVNANSGCLGLETVSNVQFSSAAFPANEGDGQANITVSRVGDTSGAASVNYATSDTAGLQNCTVVNGRASERCDYVTSMGTVRFAPGETSKNINVPLIDDVWQEGAETFTVTLTSAAGATLSTPSSATVTIADNDLTPPTNNPIDGVQFFVRQQYLDFLNRQPDQTGFNNWVNTLAPCPNGGFGEPPTSNCDRLHVAAGFFQSDEFLNRGYWAFRFYMVSYNQRPTYAQFIPDMAQVGGPKSPAEEEASKVAFADAFVQRPEFVAKYGGLSGQALANALMQTAGLPNNTFTATGSMTNGQILRGIAETSAAFNQFLTDGTVAIQYFGFLRRDPDTIGYQNNLATLRSDPNNLRHMIFIFIYSSEYRGRFGPP